ncbi:MAG: PKD domain-containing protein, partial [Bacteroidetes bacterium]
MKAENYSSIGAFAKPSTGSFKKTTQKNIWSMTLFRGILILLMICLHALPSLAQTPLSAVVDPLCTTQCCDTTLGCVCSAGVIASGGVPPYSYTVFGGSGIVGTSACVSGLCAGTYIFSIRDSQNNTIQYSVTIGAVCCKLNCRDTTICFDVPDSLVILKKPTYTGAGAGGGGTGPGPQGPDCAYDSIWNNSPGVYPVGTTVVTWYVLNNGVLDSCTQNVIRNPPSVYNISFTTSPPIVGGVINICNGQSITFTDNSTGTTGRLWNFGNGFYSTNQTNTQPAVNYPPGTYYDTLTVYDACGTPHDTAFTVVVDSASGPDIFCISVVCPGDTVTYYTSAVCSTYTWSVTGGTFLTIPTGDSATVVWGAGPSGTIALNVLNCSPALTCPFGTVKTVTIVPAVIALVGDTITCAGSQNCYSIQCLPGNIQEWELSPAYAGTISGQGTCCICINWAPGFFGFVTITVNYQNMLTGSGCNLPEDCSQDPGCGGTGTLTVHVRPIFGITGPLKVCPNVSSAPFDGMNLTNNTTEPATSWKLVSPSLSVTTFASTSLLNAYTWNGGAGVYQLTAYAPLNSYCNDSATVSVEVVDMLTPNNIVGPDTVCPNVPFVYSVPPNMSGVTYTWTVSGGTIIGPSTGSSVNIQWSPGGGTISVIQSLTAPPGCASLASATFTVVTWPSFPLPVVTASTINVCLKSNVTYSIPPLLLSGATYIWSIVPATAGNIITANGTNQVTINWVDASGPPIFVKLKISRCYEDSVMFPVNLLALPPVPDISFTPPYPCKNDQVFFSTTNAGPSWNWDFGDAGTSTLQNPSHTYTSAGNFNVQLYVTNSNGCSDTAYTSVNVEDIPVVPTIIGGSNVCINNTINYYFTEPLFMGANYTWSLSAPALGGIVSSGNSFMNILWTSPGVDTVKLHVQSPCIDTIIKYVVTIYGLPTAGVGLPSPACEGSPLTFTGTGGTNYSWTFSGGSPGSSISANPVITYAVAGTYPLTLSIVDANGCTANSTTSITVNPLPTALISGSNGVCSWPATITLTAVTAPGYTFLWSTGATTSSITATINSTTSYSCVVTNAFGCTRQSNTKTITDGICDTVPNICIISDTIDFTSTPPVCLSQTYTMIGTATHTGWLFGDGGSAGPVSPITHTYPYPGIYPVQVLGTATGVDTAGNPCSKIVAKTYNKTIPFDAKFDVSFQCNGSNQMQTIFTNNSLYLGSAGSYTWTWKDSTNNVVVSSSASPSPVLLSSGSHLVYLAIYDPVTMARCTLMKTINVPLPIVAAFSISAPVCQGTAATFTDNSINILDETSRLFNNGNGGTSPQNPASLTYALSGPFTASLSVTDKYGCTSVATQLVNVLPMATGTITVGPLSCDSVQLTSSGPGPFTWNIISPPPFPTNPVYVKTSGYYSVSAVDGNGCPFTVGPVYVTVNKSPNVVIGGKTTYCQGENLDLKTQTAGVSFVWNRIAPTFIGGVGSLPNLTNVASVAGTFTYQVIVTGANGCTGSASITITVDPVPSSASIIGGPLTFCDGDSVLLTVAPPGVSYLWSKSPTPPLSPPANTNDSLYAKTSGIYSVIVQTASGCAYPAIPPVTVVVNPIPPAAITGDTVVCEGETLTLKSTPDGGSTYAWTGSQVTGNTNPFIQPGMTLADAGPYIVVVTNTFGCTSTDTVTVIVNPTPTPPFIISNPGGVLCESVLFNFSIVGPLGPPIVYNWSTGQMGTSINAAIPGDYSVTATNQFGCSAASNILTIHPKPDLSCTPSGCYDFCSDCGNVTIPGPVGITNYEWQKLVGGIFVAYSFTQNLVVSAPGGVYRLMGSNQWGCADSSDTLKIDFHDCCPIPDLTSCLDTCNDFNNINLNGWQPNPAAPNVGVNLTNVGSQGGVTDYFISASDLAGPSQLMAGSSFYRQWCCGEFCYDYKIFDDGVAGSVNVNPVFTIHSGTLAFSFTSSQVVTENSPWTEICAPISDCNPPPISALGVWAPLGGTVMSDWTTVLSNVTQLNFRVDISAAVGETTGFDNACLNSDVPEINAGADTTICAGDAISLHVEGCNSIPEWYMISQDTLVLVGTGEVIDVSPTENTCYVVICCNVGACCCDSDTICVNVNPLPKLSWPTVYPDVCQNSDSIFLDASNILVFINPNWVPVTTTGGTGVFSGPGVVGNYFYPLTLGTHTITYTYTDSLGCSASVSNIINVIFCCDTSCVVDAGPDITICEGDVAIITATGCTGTVTWSELDPAGGRYSAGAGFSFEVSPLQTTCYVVTCCCDSMAMCCTSDTICVIVNPHPDLQWPTVYPDVCQNSDSIFLDASNILVFVNPNWVPVTSTGGTGVFSGPGVVGNYFYPTTLGLHTIIYTYTDSLGCSATIANTINVIYCCDTSCVVSAGPDITICEGNPAILTADGCTGTIVWYKLTAAGPVVVGQGPEVDVFPQVGVSCYVVECCCPGPVVCCSTDTICV